MAAKRTGLGRGIGALIPTSEQADERPADVFFPRAVAVAEAEPPVESVEPDGQDDLVEVPGARLAHIDPHDIVPNPRQPRTNFDPEHFAELVHSVREFGVLQPVVVRRNEQGQHGGHDGSEHRQQEHHRVGERAHATQCACHMPE